MTVTFGYVGVHRTRLGESPVWDVARGLLWWVDVVDNSISGAAADGSAAISWQFDQSVGSIGLAEDGLVAALADGFYRIDGTTGVATLIARAPGVIPPLRFNDGKADRFGRFLSGTMKVGDMVSKASSLWQLDRDGSIRCAETGVGLSNAICFSPDGGTMYFADSLDGIIRRYAYDGVTGALSARDDFLDTRPYGSGPDGATVDAEGRLWVALVQGQAIGCFAPDGTLIRKIDVPMPYPSCPAFGGAAMDTLFVTSISDSGHSIHVEGPTAGRILAITGLGAVGLPEGRYAADPIRKAPS